MENHTTQSLTSARRQRREMSLPEGLLWQKLRQRPHGVKFRNHHPMGSLVVDFYCTSKKLAIEIDGISHDMGDNPARDRKRDAWLLSQGIHVVRIAASEVLRDPLEVADGLAKLCADRPPPSAAGAAATSPKGGDSGVTA
ncbi:endonuclease domain-containing protein [Alteriqipengyuania flavescens]|uniref:endonuclease domain-containing protein n=1 Tax=Alteriqipengyuania flavescens TaxID=3053610 RepID=UPI0025B5D4E3|nr:endonuclease domain-containing protein [Alteriqipengyuania flavescens]WJY18763.1 endonuclease domain-containing protein [Alteriqipengyuania flavescens]WJY24703.1 endonuclease domain-containing protein [Alteriqipengyuania flavescens]